VILTTSALLSLAVFAVMAGYMSFLRPNAGPTLAGRVEIIKTQRVGIYDVQVVKADQAEGLIEWLDENEFEFDGRDQQVFSDYMRRGWCLVWQRSTQVTAPNKKRSCLRGSSPADHALSGRRPHLSPALTSTAGHKTPDPALRIRSGQWTSNGRLELHYAAKKGTLPWSMIDGVEEEDGALCRAAGLFYRRRIRSSVSVQIQRDAQPEQMQEDLVFTRAENEQPYRRQIIVW